MTPDSGFIISSGETLECAHRARRPYKSIATAFERHSLLTLFNVARWSRSVLCVRRAVGRRRCSLPVLLLLVALDCVASGPLARVRTLVRSVVCPLVFRTTASMDESIRSGLRIVRRHSSCVRRVRYFVHRASLRSAIPSVSSSTEHVDESPVGPSAFERVLGRCSPTVENATHHPQSDVQRSENEASLAQC
jgi:hypothetical protein